MSGIPLGLLFSKISFRAKKARSVTYTCRGAFRVNRFCPPVNTAGKPARHNTPSRLGA